MKSQKGLTLMLSVLAVTSLSGCGNVSGHGGDLEAIVKTKTLVVGTNAEYAPFEYLKGASTEVYGYDMDVVSLIKEEIESQYDIDLKVVVKDMAFDGLIGSMNANQIDFIAAAFSKNDERAKSVLFSDIYYQAETVLVVKEGNNSITDYASLAGLAIGAQLGTVQVDFASEAVTSSGSVKPLGSIATLLSDLSVGNIDALMVEKPVAQNIIAKSSGYKIIDNIAFPDDDGYAFASNYNIGEDLINLINGVITVNKENGVLDGLFVDALNKSLGN
ncbi:MAG: transporter substrate-binding domain-containing protein [Bacilli bacterium]